jgi:hypothetical protein
VIVAQHPGCILAMGRIIVKSTFFNHSEDAFRLHAGDFVRRPQAAERAPPVFAAWRQSGYYLPMCSKKIVMVW